MNEFDKELAGLFEDEQNQHSAELEAQLTYATIDSKLTEVGAHRVWKLDKDACNDEISRQLKIREAAHEASDQHFDENFALQEISEVVVNELSMVGRIALITTVKANGGFDALRESQEKKKIEALLIIGKFHEGWLNAVDGLLDGEHLDLAKDEDFVIYTSTAMDTIDGPDRDLIDKVQDIIYGSSDENSIESTRLHRLAFDVFTKLLFARGNENKQVNFLAFIDEQLREGSIQRDQYDQILVLLAD